MNHHPGAEPGPDSDRPETAGPAGGDAVKAALAAAKAAAQARGVRPGDAPSHDASRHARSRRAARARRRSTRYTGSGPDERDPQPLGALADAVLQQRGWTREVAAGGVFGRWRELVGHQVAEHAEPESFIDGTLTIRTSSTAWATQMRLLVPSLLRRLHDELGEDVVGRLVVLGPDAPSWRRGPRSAPGGRGPRDTYG
ncbi:MAG: RNA-binding protein [Micrococcales bacterium]|nr:MAG: RNA-binding protein [Micrococcales bacterium]